MRQKKGWWLSPTSTSGFSKGWWFRAGDPLWSKVYSHSLCHLDIPWYPVCCRIHPCTPRHPPHHLRRQTSCSPWRCLASCLPVFAIAMAHFGFAIRAQCRAVKFVLENGSWVPQLPVGHDVRHPQPATCGAVEPSAVRWLVLWQQQKIAIFCTFWWNSWWASSGSNIVSLE